MYIDDLKFSLWADFIERDYLDKEFKELIAKGIINGATSNPAIFKNAILNSPAYKEQLASLGNISVKDKYEAVAIYDIKTNTFNITKQIIYLQIGLTKLEQNSEHYLHYVQINK